MLYICIFSNKLNLNQAIRVSHRSSTALFTLTNGWLKDILKHSPAVRMILRSSYAAL